MKTKQVLRTLLIISAAVLCSQQCAFGQTQITLQYNGIRVGDVLNRQQVPYASFSEYGEDVIWDISDLSDIGNNTVKFCCDSDSIVFYEITPKAINKYSISNDTLYYIGYETPLKKIDFSSPMINAVYPFEYGQFAQGSYEGHGLYCQLHKMESFGSVSLEADATGRLIISENDTLDDVIRIHKIRTGAIGIYPTDSLAAIHQNMKQEIEDSYIWYARGYRYPIFESSSISYYDNLDFVSCVQSSNRYLPDRQLLLNDSLNKEILHSDSLLNMHNQQDIINYTVEISGGMVKINYSLTQSADITLIICNYMGRTYRSMTRHENSGDNLEIDINCSGLDPDMYVLYINVNGKVYSEKFNLR